MNGHQGLPRPQGAHHGLIATQSTKIVLTFGGKPVLVVAELMLDEDLYPQPIYPPIELPLYLWTLC